MQIIRANFSKIFLSLLILGIFLFISLRLDLYLQFDPAGYQIGSRINDFVTTFRSIIIQAVPFLVLGVGISVVVAIFFREEWILKILPKNRFLSHILLSFLGILMPVCECGNVPVARNLVLKGFKVSQAMTFLLAAPIINPITIWATAEAFGSEPLILVARVLSGFFIANFIGILLSYKSNQIEFMTDKFYKEVCDHEDQTHTFQYNVGSLIKEKTFAKELKEIGKTALNIFQREFITVFTMLCIGAFIASASITFIPREVILSIGQSPLLSIVAMILFSFVISICSSVDAFVVLPYASSFTLGSIVSFLVFGPMIDIKILTMLKSAFRTKFLITVASLVTLFSILVGLIVNYVI